MEVTEIEAIKEDLAQSYEYDMLALLPFRIKDGKSFQSENGRKFTRKDIILGRAYDGKVYFSMPINNKGIEYVICPTHFVLSSNDLDTCNIYTPEFKEDEREMMYNVGFFNEGIKQIVEDNRKDVSEDQNISKLKGLAEIFDKKPAYSRKLFFKFKDMDYEAYLESIDIADGHREYFKAYRGKTIVEGRCLPIQGTTVCHFSVCTKDLEELKRKATDENAVFDEDVYNMLIQKYTYVHDILVSTDILELVNIEAEELVKYRELFKHGFAVTPEEE